MGATTLWHVHCSWPNKNTNYKGNRRVDEGAVDTGTYVFDGIAS